MEITQTSSEDLRRQFTVIVAQSDLEKRVTTRLEEMKPRMHLKGFRPGKAPISFLKKQFGKSLMGEVVEAAVQEGSEKAIADNALKPALQPRIEPVGDVAAVVNGKADLQFTVTVDLMPDFEITDLGKLQVERLTADVKEEFVAEALTRLAEQSRTYTPRPEGEAAEKSDITVIDYTGSVDGAEFPGGRGEDFSLTIGSGQFIPGFEDQLVGAKSGETREVKVTFPADYTEKTLAAKDAVFVVKVKEVRAPHAADVDEEFAKKIGFTDLASLKERMHEQVKSDFARASRLHLKRRILDALDKAHNFPLPPAMVEGEFASIWTQVEAELKREGKTFADEGKTEAELRAEYRAIAERRVRLGLVLGRLGEQNGITVGQEELQRAIATQARQFPGQEQKVFEFYVKNPQAQAEVRAPMLEEKVVDFVVELAQITDRKVDRETLFKDPDDLPEPDAAA